MFCEITGRNFLFQGVLSVASITGHRSGLEGGAMCPPGVVEGRWTRQGLTNGDAISVGSLRYFWKDDALWDARKLPAESDAGQQNPKAAEAKEFLSSTMRSITKIGPRPAGPFILRDGE